jgi:hypothetical protein
MTIDIGTLKTLGGTGLKRLKAFKLYVSGTWLQQPCLQ